MSTPTAPHTPSPEPKPRRIEALLTRMGTAGALLLMLSRGQRPWMVPLVVVLLVLGLAMVLLQSVQYVAPFIYMVF